MRVRHWLSLLLCLAASPAALAQAASENATPPAVQEEKTADESGQKPPETPAAETKKECVTDSGGFRTVGSKAMFVIELHNSCEKRVRCTINAYILTSFGPVNGKKVLTLGAAAKNQEVTRSWSLPLKMAAGMANVSRSCVVL